MIASRRASPAEPGDQHVAFHVFIRHQVLVGDVLERGNDLDIVAKNGFCACAADPAAGICTLFTLGGTSGTVTSISSLPFSASFTPSSVSRWAAYGTDNTTMSACEAASRFEAPTTEEGTLQQFDDLGCGGHGGAGVLCPSYQVNLSNT
ncbi:MAG: hypothetical protein MZV63_72535 [Marinilabiliales bacterium]|nr:hypothetical protein [Marinilabiliales bacterium]